MNPDRLAAAVAQGHEDAVQAWPQEDGPCRCAAGRYSHPGRDCTPAPVSSPAGEGDPYAPHRRRASRIGLALPEPPENRPASPAGEDVERVATLREQVRAIVHHSNGEDHAVDGLVLWLTTGPLAALSARPVEHEACREERMHLLTQLASPPPGWFTLGTHVDQPDVRLEFWGDDGGGVPIWERPVQAQEVLPCDGGCSVETGGPAEDCSRHGRPVREVWEALATVQAREVAALARAEAAEAERGALRAKVRRAVNQYVTFEGPGHRVAALAYSEAMSHLRALLDTDGENGDDRG